MDNEWLNDSLVIIMEREIFAYVSNEYYATFSEHEDSL